MSDTQTYHIERLPAVIVRTGLSRSSIYASIAKGAFPMPLKLSSRSIGFVSSEIDEWIQRRAVNARATIGNA